VSDLEEIEAIKRLKYRYLRCLDQKRWDEIAECFVEEATTSYDGGKYAHEGRDRIIEFFRSALGPELITVHHVHHPEIELLSETTARGTWALEDTVIHTRREVTLRGAAFSSDEYVKVDGTWKIRSTGYERIYEEVGSRESAPARER
jgi:hypothetical protein